MYFIWPDNFERAKPNCLLSVALSFSCPLTPDASQQAIPNCILSADLSFSTPLSPAEFTKLHTFSGSLFLHSSQSRWIYQTAYFQRNSLSLLLSVPLNLPNCILSADLSFSTPLSPAEFTKLHTFSGSLFLHVHSSKSRWFYQTAYFQRISLSPILSVPLNLPN